MAKQVVKKIKLQIPAGKATPAPPVGTVLGPTGINLSEFCTKYNDATREKMGDVLPVEISIYDDRTFDFVIKTPPAAFMLKKAAGIKKGEAIGRKQGEIIGRQQGEEIGRNQINQLTIILAERNRTEDIIKAANDPEYQKKLLEEFSL